MSHHFQQPVLMLPCVIGIFADSFTSGNRTFWLPIPSMQAHYLLLADPLPSTGWVSGSERGQTLLNDMSHGVRRSTWAGLRTEKRLSTASARLSSRACRLKLI